MEALDEALAKKGGKGLISEPIVSKIKVNTAFFTDNAKSLHAFFINPNHAFVINPNTYITNMFYYFCLI